MSEHVSFTDLLAQAEKEGISFELVPIGPYEMYVKSAKAGRTSNGKLRLEATCAIIGGPQDGKTVWNQFVVSPENGKALGFFFRHMAVLGAGIEWFKPRTLNEATIAELATVVVGSRFFAEVGIANVQGGDRNQLDKIAPSKMAPGQKHTGTGAAVTTGAMMPGVPPIPSVATQPVAPVEQPVAPAPVAPVAPAPVQQEAAPAAIPEGTITEVNGQTFVYTGGQWLPQSAPAPQEPQATAPAAPKAPF